jgi:hypothetical protein
VISSGNQPPDFVQLVDWLEDRLPFEQAVAVQDAVAADAETAETVQWLRTFAALSRSMPLHEPPPVISQHLDRHFLRWVQARTALSQPSVELVATLLFDSRLDLESSGVRGGQEHAGAAHVAYTTDRADLVLDIRGAGMGLVRIDGQVLVTVPDQLPIFEAVALGPHGSTRTVDGDQLGRFCLRSVPTDATELRVTNGELTIVAALDLRGPEKLRS